jgi:hypothetical protein
VCVCVCVCGENTCYEINLHKVYYVTSYRKWDETEYASDLPFLWFAKYANADQLIAWEQILHQEELQR